MRYIALALALLALCAALCAWNMAYLCRILEQMEVLAAGALDAAGREDFSQSARLLGELQEQWTCREVYFCAVMPHKSLDTVSFSIETALGLAQTQSCELASQMRVLCRSLRLLVDTERLRLGNVL